MRAEVLLRWRAGVADASQRDAVEALRRQAYRAAPEFDWNDERTLAWSAADDAGTVLALWNQGGELVSTTRATVFAALGDAESFLEYSLRGIEIGLPTLVLSRAATAPEQARHGLFALLRQAYLSALMATPIASVIAIVYEGGPRLRSMREAGYEFHAPALGWDSEAVARARPLLALLPRSRFEPALAGVTAGLGERLSGLDAGTTAIADALRARCVQAAQVAR